MLPVRFFGQGESGPEPFSTVASYSEFLSNPQIPDAVVLLGQFTRFETADR
jgi:hypothetical protein